MEDLFYLQVHVTLLLKKTPDNSVTGLLFFLKQSILHITLKSIILSLSHTYIVHNHKEATFWESYLTGTGVSHRMRLFLLKYKTMYQTFLQKSEEVCNIICKVLAYFQQFLLSNEYSYAWMLMSSLPLEVSLDLQSLCFHLFSVGSNVYVHDFVLQKENFEYQWLMLYLMNIWNL